MLNIGSFTGCGLSCVSSLTDQYFVSFLRSVQLCKELTEKTDHGSEIRGKLRMTSVLLYTHLVFACLYLSFPVVHTDTHSSCELW